MQRSTTLHVITWTGAISKMATLQEAIARVRILAAVDTKNPEATDPVIEEFLNQFEFSTVLEGDELLRVIRQAARETAIWQSTRESSARITNRYKQLANRLSYLINDGDTFDATAGGTGTGTGGGVDAATVNRLIAAYLAANPVEISDEQIAMDIAAYLQANPIEGVTTQQFMAAVARIAAIEADGWVDSDRLGSGTVKSANIGTGAVLSSKLAIAVQNLLKKIDPEIMARVAGDDIQVEEILNATALVRFLADQEDSAEPALVHFSVAVASVITVQGQQEEHDYKKGDLVYFAPMSRVGKIFGNTENHTHPDTHAAAGVGGVLAINPKNIATHTDLDGTYTVAVEDMDLAYLRANGVNELEIWIKDEAVHTIDPWTPASNIVIAFTVDTTEETQVALSASDKLAPVRVILRNDGTYVDQVDGFMTIGDGGGSAEIPDGSIGREQLDSEVQGELAIIIDNQDKLDQLESALPFQTMQLSPASIRGNTMVSSVSLLLHNQLTKKTISSVALRIAGLPGTLDTATPLTAVLQGNGILRYTFTEAQVGTIGNSITSDVEKLTADVTITYSDSTTSVTRLAFGVQDPNGPAAPVVGPRADNIIQAAVNGADNAGVTSITLPADYATYKKLHLALWEASEDSLVEHVSSTAVLAINAVSGGRTIIAGGRIGGRQGQGGQPLTLTWTASTRVLALGGGDRIIYAALED